MSLCAASLRALRGMPTFAPKPRKENFATGFLFPPPEQSGADERNRTSNHLITNQTLFR